MWIFSLLFLIAEPSNVSREMQWKKITLSLHFCMEKCSKSKHDHGSWMSQSDLVEVLLPSRFYRQGSSKHLQISNLWENPAVSNFLPMLAPQFPKSEELWGPLFCWKTRGKQVSLTFYQEMMDSWSSEHSQRVLLLILGPDGAQKSSSCPFCLAISDQIKWWSSSCLAWWRKAANIPFLWFQSLMFPKPFSGLFFFFLSITVRKEGINTKTQLSKVFCAGLQVLLAWPEIALGPKTRSKWKCWEIQMYSLFSDNLTPQQPAAPQPTLSTQSRRHIPHRQAGSEIATLYREWVLIGEKNSSSELSRDFKGLHFPEAKFNLWLFSSSVFFGLVFFFLFLKK